MRYQLQRIEVLTGGIKGFFNCIYPVESDADSADSLRLENEKLRTQVESLKAIAEENTSDVVHAELSVLGRGDKTAVQQHDSS